MNDYPYISQPCVWLVISHDLIDTSTVIAAVGYEEAATDLVKALKAADTQDTYNYVIERKPVLR